MCDWFSETESEKKAKDKFLEQIKNPTHFFKIDENGDIYGDGVDEDGFIKPFEIDKTDD